MKYLFIILAGLFLFGCSDSSNEEAEKQSGVNGNEFSVSESKIRIDDKGGVRTIVITNPKNERWTLFNIPEWCHLDKVSSKWNEEIKITISSNNTCLTRIANIRCKREFRIDGEPPYSFIEGDLFSIYQEGKILTLELSTAGSLHTVYEKKLKSLGIQNKDALYIQKIAIVGKVDYQDLRKLRGLYLSYIDISKVEILEGKRELNNGKLIISPANIIDEELFNGFSFKTIILPNILSIGRESFSSCSQLETIKIPESVTYIGESAFQYCRNMQSIELPNSIAGIELRTFSDCESLKNIVIPSSVISIGHESFKGCSSLINISLPNSVNNIGEMVFRGCSALNNVTLPNIIDVIPDQMFYECSNLKSITLPDNISKIGKDSFNGCIKMEEITIPSKVTEIGSNAFSHVPLNSVYLKSSIPPTVDNSDSKGSFDDKYIGVCKLYIPNGSISKYKSFNYWNKFGYIIEE